MQSILQQQRKWCSSRIEGMNCSTGMPAIWLQGSCPAGPSKKGLYGRSQEFSNAKPRYSHLPGPINKNRSEVYFASGYEAIWRGY